jgi:hypothetical protein
MLYALQYLSLRTVTLPGTQPGFANHLLLLLPSYLLPQLRRSKRRASEFIMVVIVVVDVPVLPAIWQCDIRRRTL